MVYDLFVISYYGACIDKEWLWLIDHTLWRPRRKRIQQRLALYQGVCPIFMEFSDDAEETFGHALDLLQVKFAAYNFIVNQRPKPRLIISFCIKLELLTNQIPVCLSARMLIFLWVSYTEARNGQGGRRGGTSSEWQTTHLAVPIHSQHTGSESVD